jgi:type I restriction enzyme M protein
MPRAKSKPAPVKARRTEAAPATNGAKRSTKSSAANLSALATPTISTNFFAAGLHRKADQLMDILYSGGVNNPMDAIEQISYLLFLRLLSERDEKFARLNAKHKRLFSGSWARFAWGNFVTLTGDELFNAVREAMESLERLPDLSSTGKLLFRRATLKIYDRPTLRAIVQAIDQLDTSVGTPTGQHTDLKGDLFEYLLGYIATSGTNGQFRTPRHIIEMIVRLVDPKPGQRIADPAAGTAGFLLAAFRHILATHTPKALLAKGQIDGSNLSAAQWRFLEQDAFTGFDNDANMVKLAIMNLYLHGLEKAKIDFFNPLTTTLGGTYPGKQFDAILANPPFSGSVQQESILADINLPTTATELLFVKWIIDHLAPGGRAGIIVPAGVLFGSNRAAKRVREVLLTECYLQAVVNLPSGVFKPYSGVSTAALVFEKGDKGFAGTKSVWFYDLTADGFSLDDKRTPVEANDIPDVIAKWSARDDGPNSFSVPIEQLREADLSLQAGRYRTAEVKTVKHDAPADVLRDVLAIEQRILEGAQRLAGKLQ